MISFLVSLLLLATPGLTPSSNGHHYGWRNKPPRTPAPVERVNGTPGGGNSGQQGGSSVEGPSPRYVAD
jgi:hypothetical protein